MDPVPSGPDTTTTTKFLSDLMLTTAGLMNDQVALWSNILQQMRQGTYTASQLQMDLVQMWNPWIAFATFPFQWSRQSSTPLPTMLFVLDEVAETVDPREASLNVSLPLDVTPQVSALHQIGGTQKVDAKHIQVELSPERNQISVKLVQLGSGPARAVSPGFYVGPLYAQEKAARRPLALIYVFIQEPPQP